MWHKAKIQRLKSGTVRAEFPGINLAKNQSIIVRYQFRDTVHPQNIRKVWVKKHGRFMTFFIFAFIRLKCAFLQFIRIARAT